MRAMAIMQPGMFLSQPPTASTPSIIWPLTDTSMASAITSRDTREYFMPSVPMPMPSVTVGKPNTCGIAPASVRAAMARSTSGWMPALQGFMVEWPLATPTIGLSKSWSLKPTARSMARFGERATPPVMRWERQFSFLVMGFLPQGPFLRDAGPPLWWMEPPAVKWRSGEAAMPGGPGGEGCAIHAPVAANDADIVSAASWHWGKRPGASARLSCSMLSAALPAAPERVGTASPRRHGGGLWCASSDGAD